MKKTPKKFVGLHAHSGFSVGDGLSYPQEHIDFAIKNGSDALALTDHGNMNGFSHQHLHAEKLKKKGVSFKAIPGIEAYFVPSLDDWRKLYEETKQQKITEKEIAKTEAVARARRSVVELADQFTEAKMEIAELAESKKDNDEEDEGGTLVENEEETKKKRVRNPLLSRSHLVLLPKNSTGLKSLFRLVSESYIDGFYKYPRMDFAMLKEHAKGNLIASSACVGSLASRIVFDNQLTSEWDLWQPNSDNLEKIQKELTELGERFQDALGEENFYWELQFNKLGAQHLVNFHLLENSKRTGIPLVVTADSHYADPNHWRERLIYKAMAQQQIWKKQFDSGSLPQTIDELECELYPKNHDQIWGSYLSTGKEKYDFYDDEVVCDAIERTWTIAHCQIEEVTPDKKVKLPVLAKLVSVDELDALKETTGLEDEEDLSFAALVERTKAGVRFRKLQEKENFSEYMERLKEELDVIKTLRFSKYFLTYSKIMEIVGEHQLIGAARGSAGGSLLCYVCGITQVDPIRFGLLFERFLVRQKLCLLGETWVMTNAGPVQMNALKVGDLVRTQGGTHEVISHIFTQKHEEVVEIEDESGNLFVCSPNHRWLVKRGSLIVEIEAREVVETDELIEML